MGGLQKRGAAVPDRAGDGLTEDRAPATPAGTARDFALATHRDWRDQIAPVEYRCVEIG
jgi:hypothetical protein